jgi:hypothetical protein
MMWVVTCLGVVAALVYANRLRRSSFLDDPMCNAAQMLGGVASCLLALAAVNGAGTPELVGALILLYGHIAATGVPLRHGQQPPQRI